MVLATNNQIWWFFDNPLLAWITIMYIGITMMLTPMKKSIFIVVIVKSRQEVWKLELNLPWWISPSYPICIHGYSSWQILLHMHWPEKYFLVKYKTNVQLCCKQNQSSYLNYFYYICCVKLVSFHKYMCGFHILCGFLSRYRWVFYLSSVLKLQLDSLRFIVSL